MDVDVCGEGEVELQIGLIGGQVNEATLDACILEIADRSKDRQVIVVSLIAAWYIVATKLHS